MAHDISPPRTVLVLEYLARNPGEHAPSSVARGLGVDGTLAAWTLIYLARQGKVQRTRVGSNRSTYAALQDAPV